jgi:anti-sigma regulatory factor (Ser/Thr protein kinase)
VILDANVASPALARRFCDDVLCETGCDKELVADARLVVTELVTNAVVHARTAIELDMCMTADVVRIEVTDYGVDRPHIWARKENGGRGLPIVDALAQSWGVLDLGSGKTVWCELPLESRC